MTPNPTSMNNITFRRMTVADVEDADELRRLMGWNQTTADWRRLLKLSPQGCFVAAKNGVLLGTVTSITYDETLSWIGMMLVHPEHRRQGIGRHLMGEVLAYLKGRGVACIRLDATPAGLFLYEQIGFVSEWTLTRWQGQRDRRNHPVKDAAGNTRDLSEADWAAVQEIDKAALGISRADFIRSLAADSQLALVWPARGKVAGWGLLRGGTNGNYIGPLVSRNNEGALAIVHKMVSNSGDRSIFWDVPDGNQTATATARQLGFTPLRSLTRMRLGLPVGKSDPQAQFAISDPSSG